MAAEELAKRGHSVTVADQMPSVGRKFLMAGKSGLNLTKVEPADRFVSTYSHLPEPVRMAVGAFGPDEVQSWAIGLQQSLITGSTGRVFPSVMKASPLLRAWIARLSDLGVRFQTRWRAKQVRPGCVIFDRPDGEMTLSPDCVVVALGGASWSRLGSDGQWADWIGQLGAKLAPFAASNVGVRMTWSAHMTRYFGQPLKNIVLRAGDLTSTAEAIVTESGLEGGGIYLLSPALRAGATLRINLLPDLTKGEIAEKLSQASGKQSTSNRLRKSLKLPPVKQSLLREFDPEALKDPRATAAAITDLHMPYDRLGDLDEAISTAGGLCASELTDSFMLRRQPGVFAAGEMLDWDAPTGGYLLTACLASGRAAGIGAASWLSSNDGSSLPT